MKFDNIFFPIYIVVFFSLAIGTWLFTRKLNPKQKHYWEPRLTLFNIAVIGSLLLVPALAWGQLQFVLVGLVAIIFIGYISVAKVRVCEECGHVTQPGNLLSAAEFCSKCGAKLTPSTIFGEPRE